MLTRDLFPPTCCQSLKAAWERGDYKTPQILGVSSRPRYFHCDDPTCKDYYVLCWGPKKAPYMTLRPSKQSKSHSGGGPMTLIHRLSCEQLRDFCNNGGLVEAYTKCPQCGDTISITLPTVDCEVILNYRNPQWDVAFVKDGVVICAIESAHTHLTENLDQRNATNIPWYEFRSTDILDQLNLEKDVIQLEDIRQDNVTPCMSAYCQNAREESKEENAYVEPQVNAKTKLELEHLNKNNLPPKAKRFRALKQNKEIPTKPSQVNKCTGDGSCFYQTDDRYDRVECQYNCVLKPCPLCGLMGPQWLYYCHHLRCPQCSIDTRDDEKMFLSVTKTAQHITKLTRQTNPNFTMKFGPYTGQKLKAVWKVDHQCVITLALKYEHNVGFSLFYVG